METAEMETAEMGKTGASSASSNVVAHTVDAYKIYGEGDTEVRALDGVSVNLYKGQLTAIMGPSGSGKSTLMHCMAGLDDLTKGETYIGNTEVSGLSDKRVTRLRREEVGFIFQSFNLIPTLTAEENILLPINLAGEKVNKDWFNEISTVTGLGDRLSHRPSELSGGQQQRVAIARALMSRPTIVFGDEPTGNLDSSTGNDVLVFLRKVVTDFDQSIIVVTHDPTVATFSDRVIFLSDGSVVDELTEPTLEEIRKRI